MKILILGAGAVGGYFGARLHQSGADVTFLLREPRAAKIKKEGLVVKSPKGDAVLPVKVVTKGGEGGSYDVVILACKAYDLDSAIESIASAVGPDTTIVPMINTIDIQNWKTTKPLRNQVAPELNFKVPFKTVTGLNDDRNNAG